MMLKFAKAAPYIPDPERARPFITDNDRRRAAERPPQPVPFHCKPWIDGQSIGWHLFYGYVTPITLVGHGNGRLEVVNGEQLIAETNQPRVVDQFAAGHFGLSTGYTLQTSPGLVSLLLPANKPPSGLELIIGVVETDWYPRSLFLVFRVPDEGVRITLDHKMPLARVVLTPRHDELAEARPLNEAELAALQSREADYLAEEQSTDSAWVAASGDRFTHLYKLWSRRYRQSD